MNIENIKLPDDFKNTNTIYFRIPRNSCSTCVEYELKNLIEHYSNSIDKVVVITSFNENREFIIFKKSFHIEMVNYPKQLLKTDDKLIPYYFKVDNMGKVLNICLVKKGNFKKSQVFLNKNLLK